MKYKLPVYLIVFVLMISLVLAAPPLKIVQISTATTGLDVRVPSQFYIQQNSSYKFHIHTFNTTNGVPITDATCYLHFYNHSGSQIYENSTKINDGQFDYEFNISGTYFKNVGVYSYIAQCNNTGLGGFYASNFDVTPSGNGGVDDTFLLSVIVLIPLFLALFFLIISWLLPPDRYWALKIGLILLGLTSIFAAYQFAASALSEVTTQGFLYDTVIGNMTIFGIIYWCIIGVFLITFIYDIFMMFDSKKPKTGDYNE